MKVERFKLENSRCRLAGIAVQLLTLASVVMGSAGCGGEAWQVKTYPASGQISINGQPAEGAVVTLHPVGEKVDQRNSTPWGVVQSDGTFLLSTYDTGDGAPAGQYAVTVKWPLDVTDMAAAMVDRLGGAYSSAERSEWQVTVEPHETQLPPIEIKGAKVKSEQAAKPHRRAPPMPGMQTK